MCDYSLMSVSNRPAVHSEKLVTYKFHSGTVGFSEPEPEYKGWLQYIKSVLVARPECAVCVDEGARLLLTVDTSAQMAYRLEKTEEVIFRRIGSRLDGHRDAIELRNGRVILLQELPEGIIAHVLSLTGEDKSADLRATHRFEKSVFQSLHNATAK